MIVYLEGTPAVCGSTTQMTIACSSTQAEFSVKVMAAQDILGLCVS